MSLTRDRANLTLKNKILSELHFQIFFVSFKRSQRVVLNAVKKFEKKSRKQSSSTLHNGHLKWDRGVLISLHFLPIIKILHVKLGEKHIWGLVKTGDY